MKLVKLIPLLFFIALNAHATLPDLIWCDGSTDAQKQTAAAAVTPINTVYVGDVIGGNVSAFSLERNNPNSAQALTSASGAAMATAQRIPGDPKILNLVGNLIAFHHTAPVGWKKHLVLYTNNSGANVTYSNPNVNIYDVINAGAPQNKLTDWASHLIGAKVGNIGMSVAQLLSAVHRADLSHDPQIGATIEFTDGSHVDVAID